MARHRPRVTLWFDVEKRYKTIHGHKNNITMKLWFDVEKRYKTICGVVCDKACGCGLM